MHKFYLPRGSTVHINGIPCSIVDSALVESGATPEFIFKEAELPVGTPSGGIVGGMQSKGGKARAKALSKERLKEIGRIAGAASKKAREARRAAKKAKSFVPAWHSPEE